MMTSLSFQVSINRMKNGRV